jgi:hypothetical protein
MHKAKECSKRFELGDFTFERDSWAWLDVNAIAVCQGDIVPDRPIRISFRLEFNGAFAQWKLLSVEELPAGVASKALDRERLSKGFSVASRRNQIGGRLPLPLMSATHRKQVGWECLMQSKCQVNGVKNLTFSFGSASVKG